MAKTKIELINYKMIIEDNLSDYLSGKAKDGWFLTRIMFEYLIFIKSNPQNIKYQLEYGETSYEYDDFLKDMGYEPVCVYDYISIYMNNDINAPDLHSDELVRLQSLMNLKRHPVRNFIICLLLWLPIYFIFSLFFISPVTLGGLFQSIEIIPFIVFLIYLAIIPILSTIQSLVIKHIIKQVTNNIKPDYKIFNIVTKIYSYAGYPILIMYPIGLILLISTISNNPSVILSYLIDIIIIFATIIFVDKLLTKYRVHKKVKLLIMFIIVLIGTGLSDNILDSNETNNNPIPTMNSYMQEYTGYNENNGWLVDNFYFSYNTQDEFHQPDKYELLKTCLNDFIAIEVMKDDIIHYENETRATDEVIDKILEETGSYTTGDIPFYSYDKALSLLTQYNNSLVDECYYNEHFMIARKDNKVLLSYMQDEENYIDNIIEHYFKGEI